MAVLGMHALAMEGVRWGFGVGGIYGRGAQRVGWQPIQAVGSLGQ